MFRRLILFVVLGGLVAWGIYRALHGTKRLEGALPDAWRKLARQNETLAAALALHPRLDRLLHRHLPDERAKIMADLYTALDELADMAALDLDLESYLKGSASQASGDLRRQQVQLAQASKQVLQGLEQVYAELLDAAASKASTTQLQGRVNEQVQSVLQDLRTHRTVEDELRRALAQRHQASA